MVSGCLHAYRKNGSIALRCEVLKERYPNCDYCVHQYHCARTHKAEVRAEKARHCNVLATLKETRQEAE